MNDIDRLIEREIARGYFTLLWLLPILVAIPAVIIMMWKGYETAVGFICVPVIISLTFLYYIIEGEKPKEVLTKEDERKMQLGIE